MEKYKKVGQKRPAVTIIPNEIRITSQGLIPNYINLATALLQERRRREITLKGMGQAIGKTVAIAEILKREQPPLHQETEIGSMTITDFWEPIEEGLLPVEKTRNVSMITITLSIEKPDEISPGYQPPILVERKSHYNNYHRQQQPPRSYHAVGWSYQENRDPGEGRGYGNSAGGRFRNFHNGNNYQGGGYGRGGGGRYNGRGGGRMSK